MSKDNVKEEYGLDDAFAAFGEAMANLKRSEVIQSHLMDSCDHYDEEPSDENLLALVIDLRLLRFDREAFADVFTTEREAERAWDIVPKADRKINESEILSILQLKEPE